jgi:hypothetical protein
MRTRFMHVQKDQVQAGLEIGQEARRQVADV